MMSGSLQEEEEATLALNRAKAASTASQERAAEALKGASSPPCVDPRKVLIGDQPASKCSCALWLPH
jgi:hypothetical protein